MSLQLILKNHSFNTVMSREAKSLRDDILTLCLKHGAFSKGSVEYQVLLDKVISQYDTVVWERAVLFASASEILNAINRRTSSAYYRYQDKNGVLKEESRKGSVSGNKYKNIDWLSVARCDPKWWVDNIKEPRFGSIHPSAFNKIQEDFIPIYKLFTDWLLIDFSLKTLQRILEISRKKSISLITRCMELVEDRSKRSVEYLIPIIEKEQALLQYEMQEKKSVTKHSEQVLNAILDITSIEIEPVDWDPIDEQLKVNSENDNIFNKVKLS